MRYSLGVERERDRPLEGKLTVQFRWIAQPQHGVDQATSKTLCGKPVGDLVEEAGIDWEELPPEEVCPACAAALKAKERVGPGPYESPYQRPARAPQELRRSPRR
jgi:hypothetical protein